MEDKHIPGDGWHVAKLLNMPCSTLPAWLSWRWERCAGPQMVGASAELLGGSNRALSSRDEEEVVERLGVRKQNQKGAQKAENAADLRQKLQETNIS